jgi:hypothetical protein
MTEREIFFAVLDRDDPTERAAFLDQACAGDAALRRRVEALLRTHESAGTFLDVPVVEQLADPNGLALDFLAPSQKPGSLGRLDHYEMLAVVGRGGMGVVLKAFDEKLHRVVAVKVLAAPLAGSGTARKRFVREARAAAAVSHDHVIDLHAVEDSGPVPYLVMEFIDGPSLEDTLRQGGPLEVREVLRIGLQIAAGLAAAHKQGLVHRDVKPANILLKNGVGRVKITDFGLARAADDASLTQSGTVAGTPMYMSPEQAQGEAVDFRSDLFSLGSVLYAMCTGHAPFRAPTTVAVLKRVCEETPRPIRAVNPDLPPWLADLVTRLHAKAPADRFASAQEVADLLECRLAELQHGGSPSLLAQPAPRPAAEKSAAPPPARARRLWVGAAAVLVLAAGLGLTEATGVTHLRGTVAALFPREETPAPQEPVAAKKEADPRSEPERKEPERKDPAPVKVATPKGDPWERYVAELPADEQVKVVAAKLKELNPEFDGNVTPKIDGDAVVELRFAADHVTNLAPVRALAKLKVLQCAGTYPNRGPLADLSPLRGMQLTFLNCDQSQVTDLTPLEGMPLTELRVIGTGVKDLTPLKGMPLTSFHCVRTPVEDLSPLQGMKLRSLFAEVCPVSDLEPLQGMPLESLGLFLTRVKDLTPLKGMPLEYLNLTGVPASDLAPLREAKTLKYLHLADMPVTDLAAIKGLPLEYLSINGTQVADVSVLKGMPLKQLRIDFRAERDAAVLRSLKDLERVNDRPLADFWKEQEK